MSIFDWFRRRSEPDPEPTRQQVAERVANADLTPGYRAHVPLGQIFGYDNQIPPLWMFYNEVDLMLLHPNVQIALDYYKSGIAAAEFEVQTRHVGVRAFVEQQLARLWASGLPRVQEGYDYGWIGGQVMYRQDDDGRLAFDTFLTYHPRDVRVLTRGGKYMGIRVSGVPGSKGAVDLWGPSVGLAKAFWYAHRAQFGRMFGRSQILGAWRPWRKLASKDGGEDVIEMAVYRFGIRGPVAKYPPGTPNADEDGRDRRNPSNAEAAQYIAEQYKAGAAVSLPSTRYDDGNPQWELDIPKSGDALNVDSLINYTGDLEKKISMGVGVPPELLQAAETGSGYSGRQIPLEAFYEGQQTVARAIVSAFLEQVVKPLVCWNFGERYEQFDVDVLPLLATRKKRLGSEEPGQDSRQRRPDGTFGPAGGIMLDTHGWDESEHPRGQPDNAGQFAEAHMTLGQYERHLRQTGQRGDYGPGMGNVKLAHRTHVEDALRGGVGIPLDVRQDHPDLAARYAHVKPATHRQELARGKRDRKSKLVADAEEDGISAEDLHGLAAEIRQLDREEVEQHNRMLADARKALDHYGKTHRTMGARAAKGGAGQIEDVSHVPGIDVVARSMAGQYPGMFGKNYGYDSSTGADTDDDTDQILFGYLQEGSRSPMSEEDAYAKAHARLADDAREKRLAAADEPAYDGPEEPPGFVADQNRPTEPWEMSSTEYARARSKNILTAAKAHYKLGFIGLPTPDRESSRANRIALAKSAGFEMSSPRYVEAVTSWPLHKLHVAAALGGGNAVPTRVLKQYPDLMPAGVMLSTSPARGFGLAAVWEAVASSRIRLVRDLVKAFVRTGPFGWLDEAGNIVQAFREVYSQAVTISRLSAALAAIRRVANDSQTRLPVFAEAVPPADSPPDDVWATPETISDDPDAQPIVSLTMIEEAARDLARRKLLTRADFDALAAEARAESFTVAGVHEESVLGTIRDLTERAVAEGETKREWRGNVEEALGENPFLSRNHEETVFRANVQSAYSNGMDRVLENPMVADLFPYAAIDPILDARCRPWHSALATAGIDGTNVYYRDDPTFKMCRPPSDYGCRCGWRPMTLAQAAAAGVREAQLWLETGNPPISRTFVRPPANWQQSPGWVSAI